MDSWPTRKFEFPLPGFLADAAKFLRAMGRGKQIEELEVAMNRAAEAAVPLARQLLVNAVKEHDGDRCEEHPHRRRNIGHHLLRGQDTHAPRPHGFCRS